MAVSASQKIPAKRGRPPTRNRAPQARSEQQPLIETPEPEQNVGPIFVNGLRVIDRARMQNLPNVPMNIVKLTLEDGSGAYSCFDCPDVVGSREFVRTHRARTHKIASAVIKRDSPLLALNLGQLIDLSESSMAAGEIIERLEAERDRYKADRDEVTRKYDKLVRALERVGFTPKLEDEE